MEDSEGPNFVTDPADAAGNVIVIELDTGHFVVLAHLRHGTLQVSQGDRVRKGDPLALVGNSGNTPWRTFISRCRLTATSGIPTTAPCPSHSSPTAASWPAMIGSGGRLGSLCAVQSHL